MSMLDPDHGPNRRRGWCGVVSGVCLALAACDGGGDGAGTPDAATPPPAPDAPWPERLTFRLAYDRGVSDSIYVQSGTEAGGQGWLRVFEGERALEILDDCGVCNCDACDPCAVCGAGLPVVTEIPRGGSVEWEWDTVLYGGGTCAATGGACEAGYRLTPGRYTARFCWSATADGVGTGHHVGPLVCADEPFEFAPLSFPLPTTIVHEE